MYTDGMYINLVVLAICLKILWITLASMCKIKRIKSHTISNKNGLHDLINKELDPMTIYYFGTPDSLFFT